MKKIIIAILLLLVAGFSIFSYRKYSKCEKVDFSTILNKEYIYTDKDIKTDINITFSDDRIFGFSGINRYFAGYKFENGDIKFSPIGSTMMAGPEDKMELERKYLDLLNNVDKIETYKSKIILKTKNGEILKFLENTTPLNNEVNNTSEIVGPSMNTNNSINSENQDTAMDSDIDSNVLETAPVQE